MERKNESRKLASLASVIFLGLSAAVLLLSCGKPKSDEEAIHDMLEENQQSEMLHERYIDSLVNVATGLDGETLTQNRQHALDILQKEYPELHEKWVKVQESIDNGELYSDDSESADN